MSLLDDLKCNLQKMEKMENISESDIKEAFPVAMHLLLKMGNILGYDNVLGKYKYREVIMGWVLQHYVYSKSATGHGGDATDRNKKVQEYKTEKTNSGKLLKKIKQGKDIILSGVYNKAYNKENIESYLDQDHYFGLFDEETEECILIYRADTNNVVKQLQENLATKQTENEKRKRKGLEELTTNCNTVKYYISINDKNIVYRNTKIGDLRNKTGIYNS